MITGAPKSEIMIHHGNSTLQKDNLCTLSQRISLILNHCYCIISDVKTQGGGGGGAWQQLKMKYKNTIQSR